MQSMEGYIFIDDTLKNVDWTVILCDKMVCLSLSLSFSLPGMCRLGVGTVLKHFLSW